MDMGEFFKYLQNHNCEYMFKELFGIDKSWQFCLSTMLRSFHIQVSPRSLCLQVFTKSSQNLAFLTLFCPFSPFIPFWLNPGSLVQQHYNFVNKGSLDRSCLNYIFLLFSLFFSVYYEIFLCFYTSFDLCCA